MSRNRQDIKLTPYDGTKASFVKTWNELAQQRQNYFTARVEAGTLHERSAWNKRRCLERFTLAVPNDFPLESINAPLLSGFRDELARQTSYVAQTIRESIREVKECFRWGAEQGLCSPDVYASVEHVKPTTPGMGKKTRRRKPVAWASISATLPHLTPMQGAAVLVLYFSGMRPSELLAMRRRDLDTTSTPWRYRLEGHKTAKHIGAREIPIGPRSMSIFETLATDLHPDAFMFDSRRERNAQRLKAMVSRRTDPFSGNNPARSPRRFCLEGKPLTASGLYQAVVAAAEKAGVEPWFPYQLRHACATRLAREAGVEVAKQQLGHTSLRTTSIYVQDDPSRLSEAVMSYG